MPLLDVNATARTAYRLMRIIHIPRESSPRVRFQPANKAMAPILVRAVDFKPAMLLGVVVGVYRRL
jgi:hypothetical protein